MNLSLSFETAVQTLKSEFAKVGGCALWSLMKMFKRIDVWKRIDDKCAVLYRCWESLDGDGFCVQSLDVYRLPVDAKRIQDFHNQFLELFCEQPPDERGPLATSLVAAILAFDKEFAPVGNTRSLEKPAVRVASVTPLDTQILIERALRDANGNTAAAAKMLGLPRLTVKIFSSKMKLADSGVAALATH